MRSDPRCVVHAKEKEKKEKKGHSARGCDKEKHTVKSWSKRKSFGHGEKNTSESFRRCNPKR